MFDFFNFATLEAATGAKASSATVAKTRFINAVVPPHRRLSHLGLVRARRAAAHWDAQVLLFFENKNSKRTDISQRRTNRNTNAGC